MNTGFQKKTLQKYSKYLIDLIQTHNLYYPYIGINLKDNKLLKKHNFSATRSSFDYAIKNLLSLGWISKYDNYYLSGLKCYYYNLTKKFLIDNKIYSNILVYNNVDILYRYILYNPLIGTEVENMQEENLNSVVRFGSRLRIDSKYSDELIRAKMYEKYPQISYYKMMSEDINKVIGDYAPIKFEIGIHRSKTNLVTKISLRATNSFCLFPTIKKLKHQKYEGTREEELDYLFGKDNWSEIDVHGSIPKIARLVNYGIYPIWEEDPYKEMFERYLSEHNITFTDDVRDNMKDIFMRLFFGGSVKNIIKDIKGSNNYKKLSRYLTLDENTIFCLKNLVNNYCGDGDSSIFMHESCIYMEVYKELLLRRISCVQVYDAFFMKTSDVPKDIMNIFTNCAMAYYNRYIL